MRITYQKSKKKQMNNKRIKLDEIAKAIEDCQECKKNKTGKAVPGEGNPDADIVFIGEAPGKTEAKTGRPFVGRSGQLLRGLIREMGFDDEKDVYITSPVKYLPLGKDGTPGGTPSSDDIAHGRTHLMEQFQVIQPKFVVLLGRVAAEGVLQSRLSVTKERGGVIAEKDGISYFLTYHPAAALRSPVKFKQTLKEDFLKVKTLLG